MTKTFAPHPMFYAVLVSIFCPFFLGFLAAVNALFAIGARMAFAWYSL